MGQSQPCKHPKLEYIGEQKTDDGVNSYFKCPTCGDVIVVMPDRRGFSLKGVDRPAGI